MPSYAPPKPPRHKAVSQDVPRPKKLNPDWKVRAANALPNLEHARSRFHPSTSSHLHLSEAIGHMHAVLNIDGRSNVLTNADAKHTFLMAQRAVSRAFYLTRDAG